MTKAMTFKPAAYEAPVEPHFDIRELVAELRRYSTLFAVIFAVVFALILAIAVLQTPKYTSTSSVLISEENTQPLPGQAQTPDQPPDQTAVESEVELIKSRAVAERVIDQLHLQNDPEFNPALRHPTVFSEIKDVVTLKPLREQLMRAKTAGTPAQIAARIERQNIVDTLEGKLGVNRVGLALCGGEGAAQLLALALILILDVRDTILAQLALAQRAGVRVGVEQRQLAVDILAARLDRIALRALGRAALDRGVLLGAVLLELGQACIELGALF